MNRYLYSSEMVTFFLCVIIFLFALYNKPKKTKACLLCLGGLFALWFEMAIEIIVYSHVNYAFRLEFRFINACLAVQLISHFVMMICLCLYVDELSIHHNLTSRFFMTFLSVFFIGYFFTFLILTSYGWMYEIKDGVIGFSHYVSYVNGASILGTVITFIYSLGHRREYPRALVKAMNYTMPAMILMQIFQSLRSDILFHGIIYIVPLMVLFFFYHNNPYDQITGYQDVSSLDSMMQYCIRRKKDVHFIFISVPNLKDNESAQYRRGPITEETLSLIKACRNLEYDLENAKLYRLNEYTFGILLKSKNKEKDSINLEKIKNVLFATSCQVGKGYYFYAVHFPIFHSETESIKKFSQSFVSYVLDKTPLEAKSVWIEVNKSDYDAYTEYEIIEKAIIDINRTKNLNDDRVICYAQPIYDVETGRYATAEALMRMEIDGKIIYPDKFIPIAEKHECIHELTLIMLNKVCKFINSLGNRYEFDAITVNCSPIELSRTTLCADVKSIIINNDINPSKIRMELTETAMFDTYDVVSENIIKLREFGIKFYLDDFGTGYSNFERIITCPLYTIKFDKSLLYKAITNTSIDNMITTMITLFKNNGFRVLIEGVEDQEQKDYAVKRGFQSIQGYYFSKPMPIYKLTEFFYRK